MQENSKSKSAEGTSAPGRTEGRKKIFVDRSVQGSLILRIAAHWLLFLLTTLAFVFIVELLAGDPRAVGENFLNRNGPTILAALVLFPIFAVDICKLSNRFVGPMLRLRRGLSELAQGGEVEPIRLRKHDFWSSLADDFNRVVERSQNKVVG